MNNLNDKANKPIRCPECNIAAQRNGKYKTKTKGMKQRYFCVNCKKSFVTNDPNEEFEEITLKDIFTDNIRNLKKFYEELLIQKEKTNELRKYIKSVFRVLVENNISINIIYELFNKKYSIRHLQRMKSENHCDIKRIKDYQFVYNENEYYGDYLSENILTIDKIDEMFKNFEKEEFKDEGINNFIEEFYKLTILSTSKNGKKRSSKYKKRKVRDENEPMIIYIGNETIEIEIKKKNQLLKNIKI